MIKSISVINSKNEELVLTLRSPEQSGFFIKKIDGLGPPKAIVNVLDYSTIDGGHFTSSRLSPRNIVINLGFLEKPDIETTRNLSYKYFKIKDNITLLIETDSKVIKTTGYIESNEPEIFSKDTGSVISIICPDPYFYDISSEIVEFSFLDKMFSFPYMNDSTEIKLTYFGDLVIEAEHVVDYSGNIDTGFLLSIDTFGLVGTIRVQNIETGEILVIDNDIIESLLGSGIQAGDHIHVSTVTGTKYATLIRSGEEYSIMSAVVYESSWLQLTNGENNFRYGCDFGPEYIRMTLEYSIKHTGI